jgi:hypothetical protein
VQKPEKIKVLSSSKKSSSHYWMSSISITNSSEEISMSDLVEEREER